MSIKIYMPFDQPSWHEYGLTLFRNRHGWVVIYRDEQYLFRPSGTEITVFSRWEGGCERDELETFLAEKGHGKRGPFSFKRKANVTRLNAA
jgi:hypothetical protein